MTIVNDDIHKFLPYLDIVNDYCVIPRFKIERDG